MTLDEAIEERQKVIEVQEKLYEEASTNESKEIIKSATDNDRQVAEWLKELKELRKGNIETSNDKDLLKKAIYTLENVMPKYRRLSEENQKQKEQIAEYKRLLKVAVKDINFYVDCYEAHCDECCCSQDNHCHWKHEAAALKLIGEDETDG